MKNTTMRRGTLLSVAVIGYSSRIRWIRQLSGLTGEGAVALINAASTQGVFSVPVRIGYAPGAYDLFHVGHLNILRQAKARCDYLVAGVVSDEMCELTKGKRPVVPLVERMEIVANIGFVDEVYAEITPEKLDAWHELHFTHIFKGDDWQGTAKGDKLERDFSAVGVEVVYFPYTVHTSSTILRRALDSIVGQRAMAGAAEAVERQP